MNNNQQPLAKLVVEIPSINGSATHHHQVLEWAYADSKVYITMILPVMRDPDAPKWMPLRVTAFVGGAQKLLWERDWSNDGFPYLCDVDDEVVIAILKQGKLSQLIALAELATDQEYETSSKIALKQATAEVLAVEPMFTQIEHDVIERMAEALVQKDAPAEPTVFAAVSAKVSMLPAKSELVAARRTKIANRKLVTVYDKTTGETCLGIPVYESEYILCEHNKHYITINSDEVPVDFFKMKFSGNGKFHRKELVLVSAQVPTHLIHDHGASQSSVQTVH